MLDQHRHTILTTKSTGTSQAPVAYPRSSVSTVLGTRSVAFRSPPTVVEPSVIQSHHWSDASSSGNNLPQCHLASIEHCNKPPPPLFYPYPKPCRKSTYLQNRKTAKAEFTNARNSSTSLVGSECSYTKSRTLRPSWHKHSSTNIAYHISAPAKVYQSWLYVLVAWIYLKNGPVSFNSALIT